MCKSRVVSVLVLAIIMSSSVAAKDGHIGGGDLNPNLETNAQAIAKWEDARVGLTMHWGPIALRGTEIGGRGPGGIPAPEYDALYKEFNPALFDAKEWVELIQDSGFRYVTLVSKHYDGFSMWATKQSDYNIINTPFHRDWLKEMANECRRKGVTFGVYYCIGDGYQYDYTPGPDEGAHVPGFTLDRPPDLDRYVDYMKRQLKELIVDYGVEIILLDGDHAPAWNHERGSDLYRYLRGLRDDIVINNRTEVWEDGSEARGAYTVPDTPPLWMWNPSPYWNTSQYAGDYQEREEYIGGPAPYPWEAWITMGTQWSWRPNAKYKSPDDIIRYLVVTVGGGGNFNLNVTPMLDGRFEQRQKDTLLKIGAFLKANGESIYGTRGGPFEPGLWGASTQKGDTVYVHVLAWPAGNFQLFPLDRKVRSAQLLHGGEVQWKQLPKGIELSVPESKRDSLDTIVKLTLD